VSEWVSDSEITQRLGYKILIAGLSEAGKTAVKRIFFLKQRSEEVSSLSATINYERLSLNVKDTPINIVDLGGQKIFLKRFLSGFSPFVFSSVKIFVYLIDVANKTTRNNSIQYFAACLEKLNTFSPEAEVFVFLHKNDLLRASPNYESIHSQLKEQFQIEYNPRSLRFFRTTIYRPETVIDAFGRIFELVMPSLSESEFVEGRKIGLIEEFADSSIISTTPEAAIIPNQPIGSQTSSLMQADKSKAGDPAILQRLQSLLSTAVTDKPQIETKSFTGHSLNNKGIPEVGQHEYISSGVTESSSKPPSSSIKQPETVTEQIDAVSSESSDLKKDTENKQVVHLIDYYRIGKEQANSLVNSGYVDLFEMASTSGIPVPLVLNVILKYIPFVKNQKLKHIETLNKFRITELFNAYLKNLIAEDEMVQCLVIATERPNLSIKQIAESYLKDLKEERKVKEKQKEKVKAKIILPTIKQKPIEKASVNIPVITENIEGIITLPDTRDLGFRLELAGEEAVNVQLNFYILTGQKKYELIGGSILSPNVTINELIYYMAYELSMLTLGIFEGGKTSLDFAANIIHKAIQRLKANKLKSTKELVSSPKELAIENKKISLSEFKIPLEVQVQGNYLLLPDSQGVAFSLEPKIDGGENYILSFVQRGYPIGNTQIDRTLSLEGIKKLIKDRMQIPLETVGAFDFASRLIHASLQTFIQATVKQKKGWEDRIPKFIPEPVDQKEKEVDETSEKLKHYLALLEDD